MTGQALDEDHRARSAASIPKVKQDYIAHALHAVREPAVREPAPDGAVYKRDDGIVMIDPEKAAGKKDIVTQLPLPQ